MPKSKRRTGWRKPHGNAAKLGASLVWETPPSDEQRPAPEGASVAIGRRSNGTFTSDGARVAARLRDELAKLPDFAEGELEFAALPAFQPFDAARRGLLSGCGSELFTATGGASRRVWAILRGAAWLTSFGEYWATEAARTGDGKAADRAASFLSKASVEYQKAWDAACVEAEGRKAANPGASHAAALAAFSRPAPVTKPAAPAALDTTGTPSPLNGTELNGKGAAIGP
jgi:hypothetical protein